MKYQRVELHNHSTESDGDLTVEELMRWAEEESYGVIALTDHNTCSGHEKAARILQKEHLEIELLKGVEITTFYGHILALGMDQMIDFTGLDPEAPEYFLKQLRAAGAGVIGLAHPFCIGRPVTAGCRMDMEIHDWDQIDYIEVFNTSGGTEEMAGAVMGNKNALEFWEEQVLKGYKIAAVTGKDIHKKPQKLPVMITYALIEEMEETSIKHTAQNVLGAIMQQRTFVTKGPLLQAKAEKEDLLLFMDQSSSYEEWNKKWKEITPILRVRGKDLYKEIPLCFSEKMQEIRMKNILKEEHAVDQNGDHVVVIRLYDGSCNYENLLAAGICVRWREGGEEV